jgi:HK97 family phage major capsid protein
MPTAVKASLEELEATLRDNSKVRDLLRDGKFGDFVRDYAEAKNAANPDIATQVREETQRVLAQMLKENGQGGKFKLDLTPEPGGKGVLAYEPGDVPGPLSERARYIRKNRLYNKAAPGARVGKMLNESSKVFDEPTDFFRALSLRCNSLGRLPNGPELLEKLALNEEIRNSFSTNVPADGGFLIPEEFRSDMLLVALETSLIRSRATVIPMGSQRVSIPMVDSTTDATSVFGGIICTWVDEATQPTEVQGKFGAVALDAKKLMAYVQAPNELVADAPAFGGYLDAQLPQAISFYEDAAFMAGSGVGEPLGFVNCPAAVIAAATSGQGANTIVVENLAAMFSRMLPSSLSRAVWLASIDTFPQLSLMAVQGAIGNSSPVWMNNGVVGAPPVSIYGRPVYFTEKLSTLGTTGDIVFVDPAFYLIGDRQAMQATASPHVAFNKDMTAYKIIERLDGRPWLQSAITPKNAGPTLSAFVQLSSTRT